MAIGLSRATVPQNFFDITSDRLLLAPDPQYVYAQLILNTFNVNLSMPDMVGLPGRQIGGQGADYQTVEQGQLMLESDVLTSGAFAVDYDFNGAPGTSVRFNRPSFTNWAATNADRRLRPGQTISTTSVSIASEQTVLVLDRFAGPYSSTTSGSGEVAPIALEKFDAGRGVHNLVRMAGLHLVRDFHRFLEIEAVGIFDSAASTVYPRGMTDANTPTVAGEYQLDWETCTRLARTMDDAYVPKFPDGRRVLVLTPQGMEQLRQDPIFINVAKENERTNPLFQRYTELKYTLPEWHIFQNSNLTTAANTSSVTIHTGHAIAPGCAGVGMGGRPEVRFSTNDNYGESVPVIWIAYMAFANLDSRFCYKLQYAQSGS